MQISVQCPNKCVLLDVQFDDTVRDVLRKLPAGQLTLGRRSCSPDESISALVHSLKYEPGTLTLHTPTSMYAQLRAELTCLLPIEALQKRLNSLEKTHETLLAQSRERHDRQLASIRSKLKNHGSRPFDKPSDN